MRVAADTRSVCAGRATPVLPRAGVSRTSCMSAREGSQALPTRPPPAPAPWLRLSPRWQAPTGEAMRGALAASVVSPAWRLLLLSDGSVTRHLQIVSDNETEVEVIRQDVGVVAAGTGAEPFPLPMECAMLVPPLLQRQVWLRAKPDGGSKDAPSCSSPGPPLVYACSWWHEDAFRASMRAEGAPIWRNLAAARTEAYRDLCDVYLGDNAALETAFGTQGPFWGRHYVLYAGGKPLTVVYEVFGPSLATWLGDSDGRAAGAAS